MVSHPLVDGDGEPYYDWETINTHVQEALGQGVNWAPLGPLVRAPVAGLDNPPPLHDEDWLEIVDVDEWKAERHEFNGARPVIGRHSRPDPLKWPDDRDTILAAYPDDPACAVRILGGGGFLSDLVGPYPDNWEVLPFNSENPKEFLETIDFFVYFHHSRWVEAFGRVLIEAMASGALAILPPHFKPVLGDGAAYGEPEDVKDLVAHFYSDRQAYLRQTQAAREVLEERFSPTAHVARLKKLIGPPRSSSAVPVEKAQGKSRHALFVTSNGVGMGHLTRMLAIARRCPPGIQPVFVTMSQAMRVVEEQGFLAEYIPFHGYLKCDLVNWNHFLRHEINELISFYQAQVLIFDGNIAYGGLVSALNDNPSCLAVWCRRAMWRPGAAAEENIRRETAFHGVIEPGEIAAAYDAGLTTEYRERTRLLDPIRLLDDEEILDREEALAELGLDPNRPAVLLQLGSGNNYDYEQVRSLILERLEEEGEWQVVVAEWLISNDPLPLPEGVLRLKRYPIGRLLKAFDFVVSAAGYNGFHEILLAGIPAIFIPNENPIMDEQLTRAQYAERNGLGLCLRTREVYRVRPYLDRMLDPGFRAEIRTNTAKLNRCNGAVEAAKFIEELMQTVRADREPRGFWTLL